MQEKNIIANRETNSSLSFVWRCFLNNAIKKICLIILGLLQGTLGSYLALLGWAFAFPETSSGAKDYAEDMSFVPLGYIIMFAWLAIMITAINR